MKLGMRKLGGRLGYYAGMLIVLIITLIEKAFYFPKTVIGFTKAAIRKIGNGMFLFTDQIVKTFNRTKPKYSK